MTMRKTFTFNGHNSAEFGLFITGAAVYDAPQYDYDFVSIPGRSGDLILDNGRFHNLEVRYPAFVVDPSQMAAIRAWLLGARGYQRLTDDYNPDEYRMAVYAVGLEGDPFNQKAVNFDIVFNCKPQRYALEAEEPITFAAIFSDGTRLISGETEMAGTLEGDGQTVIEDYNSTAGSLFPDLVEVRLAARSGTGAYTVYNRAQLASLMTWNADHAELEISAVAASWASGGYISLVYSSAPDVIVKTRTAGAEWTETKVAASGVIVNPTPYKATPLLEIIARPTVGNPVNAPAVTIGEVTVATAAAFTGALYVDAEIQDAYLIEGGEKTNANSNVVLSKGGETTTDFPELVPGENAISLVSDTTISDTGRLGVYQVQILPRWYTV